MDDFTTPPLTSQPFPRAGAHLPVGLWDSVKMMELSRAFEMNQIAQQEPEGVAFVANRLEKSCVAEQRIIGKW